MRPAALAALVLAAAGGSTGGSASLDAPLDSGTDGDLLQYDDGTAYWLTWSGLYRGTWFDIADFGYSGAPILQGAELWFYHHPSYPWDTSSFFCEVYQGGQTCPVTQLDWTSVLALHNQPAFVDYYPPGIYLGGGNFWLMQNTEMSSGGWPSILVDGSPNTVEHSFWSDDFIVWTPWTPGGHTMLESTTWGEVKALYRDVPDPVIQTGGDFMIRGEIITSGPDAYRTL